MEIENLGVTGDPENLEPAAPVVELETPLVEDPILDSETLSEDETIIEESADDTPLVKKLRGLLKESKKSLKEYETRVSEKSTSEEFLEGLFGFDADRGVPSSQIFAQKLVEKDQSTAIQALMDLSSQQIREDGWTIGHEFLTRIGLDPYKIEELQKYSKGELAEFSAPAEIPEVVPPEYREAFKGLSEVNREDIEVYLNGTDLQKQSALQILRNEQYRLDSEKQSQVALAEQNRQYEETVFAEAAQKLDEAYLGLLENVKKNPAYEQITISANPEMDAMVKGSIIAQITALGDPNRLISRQAADMFKSQGIQVNLDEISSLMKAVEDNTVIAVKAEKAQIRDKKDYKLQINEALQRRTNATVKLLSIANRVFAQTLSKYRPTQDQVPQGSLPVGTTGTSIDSPSGGRAMNSSALDELTNSIIKGIQSSNAS